MTNLTAFHTCTGHPDGHVGTFEPMSRTRLGCGCQRYRVRRCDGTEMQLFDGACATHDNDLQARGGPASRADGDLVHPRPAPPDLPPPLPNPTFPSI